MSGPGQAWLMVGPKRAGQEAAGEWAGPVPRAAEILSALSRGAGGEGVRRRRRWRGTRAQEGRSEGLVFPQTCPVDSWKPSFQASVSPLQVTGLLKALVGLKFAETIIAGDWGLLWQRACPPGAFLG